ncbi:hypothetical protein PaG_05728 [Moesziomyces aphidis]|uniref:Uncharacterized protein n=1 Tax=Moesziomyces aphidis TaxID=84754 RepID=W3VHC0_MOEAP|nr:hypothetical protein PaG_05728 [Moesziomyces aphidis]
MFPPFRTASFRTCAMQDDDDEFAGGQGFVPGPDGLLRPIQSATRPPAPSATRRPVDQRATFVPAVRSPTPRPAPQVRARQQDEPEGPSRQVLGRRSRDDDDSAAEGNERGRPHPRVISAAMVQMGQWLTAEHFPDIPCPDCSTHHRPCVAPDADSQVEKCLGCSDKRRAKRCPKKWILERTNVAEMVRLTEEHGMTKEDARIQVYGPLGQLGGRWDRKKDYPAMPAAARGPCLPNNTFAPSYTLFGSPPMAGPSTAGPSTRSTPDLLNLPDHRTIDTRRVQDAFLRAVEAYRAEQPTTTAQLNQMLVDLLLELWESMAQ